MPSRRLLSPTHYIYLLIHLVLLLFGALLTFVDNSLLKAVGASIIAAGLIGYILFVYMLFSERLRDRINNLIGAGLVNAFPRRATRLKGEYDQLLRTASDRIDIIAFGLRALREDYKEQIGTWKRRARVRILLIDPDYPSRAESFARQRDREEGNEIGNTERDVKQFIEYCSDWLDDRFQIRLYRCLPAINIFRVDGQALWGPYLIKEEGRNTPTILVESSAWLFRSLTRHFDQIWDDPNLSRNVPAEWLGK